MAQINLKLPDKVRNVFKSLVAADGLTMQDVLLGYILDAIDKGLRGRGKKKGVAFKKAT